MIDKDPGALLSAKRNGLFVGGHDLTDRRVLQGVCRNDRQVVGSGIVVLVVQAVRVYKMGVLQAKLTGALVHPVGKFLHAVGNRQGERHGGVVCRG